ncbi:MAG: glycosyltransferase [Clostridia bacterium]|nr:glycosyltransferase [Clostridia bacterium]
MKKICYCTTIPLTINAFILKSAEYIHEHTDWDISFISDYDEEFAASLPDYIHYYPIPMKRGISLGGIKAMREMKRIFKREKFDLVQFSTPNASLYASMASKSAKIPVRLYCQWGMVYVGFSGIKRKIFKTIEKYVCKNATWIEPDSKLNLKFAHDEGLYPESIGSVIWNGSSSGINLNKFDISKKSEYRAAIRQKHNIPDDALVYVFVGRINRDKGINELLEAYKNMSAERSAYLMIVGPSEMDETVNAELYNWSLTQEKIIYTGGTKTVEQYLAAADCFVLPSYREGLAISALESQAMGLPLVVTDIRGLIDAVVPNETALAVPSKDAAALQSALEAIYDNPSMREEFGRAAHKHICDNFEQQRMFAYILEDRKRLLGEQ